MCSVTNCELSKVLISSHIVPWSQSNEDERLDVGNGILLSPNLDSLFDGHLISFKDSGEIIISKNIKEKDLELLGVTNYMKLRKVFDDMKPYLSRHREVFDEKN
jgi:predicted restriction endonuclease